MWDRETIIQVGQVGCVIEIYSFTNTLNIAIDASNSDMLKMANVDLLTLEECKRVKGDAMNEWKVCAGNSHHNACRGDSGGPLQCRNSNGQWVLAGVSSVGPAICENNIPSIYMNVLKYLPWIEQIRSEFR